MNDSQARAEIYKTYHNPHTGFLPTGLRLSISFAILFLGWKFQPTDLHIFPYYAAAIGGSALLVLPLMIWLERKFDNFWVERHARSGTDGPIFAPSIGEIIIVAIALLATWGWAIYYFVSLHV